MKGLVAIPCRPDSARYIDFFRSLIEGLELPSDWKIKLYPGFFPDYSVNNAITEAIKEGYDYVFIADDDMIFHPQTIKRLLLHNVDIVCCNLLYRNPPFNPYLYEKSTEDGRAIGAVLDKKSGLIEVGAISTGGALIKTEVFKKLEFPYFATDDTLKTYDLYFSHKARQAGLKLHYDLDTCCGHIVMSALWPEKVDGVWQTSLVINNALKIPVPAAILTEDGFRLGVPEHVGNS